MRFIEYQLETDKYSSPVPDFSECEASDLRDAAQILMTFTPIQNDDALSSPKEATDHRAQQSEAYIEIDIKRLRLSKQQRAILALIEHHKAFADRSCLSQRFVMDEIGKDLFSSNGSFEKAWSLMRKLLNKHFKTEVNPSHGGKAGKLYTKRPFRLTNYHLTP